MFFDVVQGHKGVGIHADNLDKHVQGLGSSVAVAVWNMILDVAPAHNLV